MYHFELRKFPHTVSRFNQTEQQMLALAVPWTREEWVEVGERKWNVNETTLTVLEGPELSLQDMSMNRGWRNARRRSTDVTERVIAAARAAGAAPVVGREAIVAAASGAAPAVGAPADAASPAGEVASGASSDDAELGLLADSLALEILAALDSGPVPLAEVWRLAHERLAGRPPGESLVLAERSVRSLLARRLVVVRRGDRDRGAQAAGGGDAETDVAAASDTALGAVESWAAAGEDAVVIARSA
ncbi:MAG: hypothetical protein JWM66_626 [Solirubrobacterales bacterium]|nr:hypothetical protein [Solirubrobacterales bacterium]